MNGSTVVDAVLSLRRVTRLFDENALVDRRISVYGLPARRELDTYACCPLARNAGFPYGQAVFVPEERESQNPMEKRSKIHLIRLLDNIDDECVLSFADYSTAKNYGKYRYKRGEVFDPVSDE